MYGSARYEPMDEAHPKEPTTTYAAGKAAADVALESYVKMFDVDAFIVRPFNNYGPRQNYKEPLAAVIPLTAWRILGGQQPEIQGEGTQSRDFIYVGDTVDAVVKLFGVMTPGDSVNISSDGQISIKDLVSMIGKQMKYSGEDRRTPPRKADVLCHNASNAKVRALIDYPLTPIEKGLKQTIDVVPRPAYEGWTMSGVRLIKPFISFEDVEADLRGIFDSGMFTGGQHVKAFRAEMAAATRARSTPRSPPRRPRRCG